MKTYKTSDDTRRRVREWYAAHKGRVSAYKKLPHVREAARKRCRSQWIKARLEVINGYGGKCTCCSEWRIEFLTLEHVGGWGKIHRIGKGGYTVYRDVIKEGFPIDKYTVLCWNCNHANTLTSGCPHKLERSQQTGS